MMKQNSAPLWSLVSLLAAHTSQAGLVAHYKFDEPASATTALNDVAGSETGAIGSNITTGVTGIAGNAYSFLGATATQNDAVDMGNAAFLSSLAASGQFSFTAWVKTTDTTGNRNTVVFAGDDTATSVYADLGVAAGLAGNLGSASARNRPTGTTGTQAAGIFSTPVVAPVNDDAWHHLVMTVDTTTATLILYVDGVPANTQTMATNQVPLLNNFEIGRLGRSAPVDAYNGLVDDVQIYDSVLTALQIAWLKNHPGQAYTGEDSDLDGLDDAWETQHFGNITSQSGNDVGPDNDGATNLQEQAAGTNPTVADTDSDGRTDGEELNTEPFTDPLNPDSDGDGLTDGAEVKVHFTNPNEKDTDFDTLPDGWEIAHTLNPNSDAGDDGATGDPDQDGLYNADEYHGGVNSTNPRAADTDLDGYTDLQENRIGFWSSLSATGTNPTNPDTDGDGLPDGQENPEAAYVPGVTSGTDPNQYDSDGDRFGDQTEFLFGTSPVDQFSFPAIERRGLIAHYKFDEPASAPTAVNALGHSPGTVGANVVTGATGIAGSAYQFNNSAGQADIVDMANARFLTDISSTKALTFTAWIKSTDTSGGRNTIFSAANTALDSSYIDAGISGSAPNIGALSGRLRPNGNANLAEIFSNTAPSAVLVNDDVWHHVALTIDLASSTQRLYVDGTLTTENTALATALFPMFNNFEIGRLGRKAPTDAFGGLIDDVQVYNEALAPARIAALHTMPGRSTDEDHDGLDDQWEIDNFGSITAQDGSGDPDGDGISNEAEETAGTSPGVRTFISAVSFVPGGAYTITVKGAPDTTYHVTKSTSLTGFAPMVPPVTLTTDANGDGTAAIPAGHAAGSTGFYRLELP